MDSWTIRKHLVTEKTFSKILYITYMTTQQHTHTHTHTHTVHPIKSMEPVAKILKVVDEFITSCSQDSKVY